MAAISTEALDSVFHEPSRLAIMTELTGAKAGVSFGDLKAACNMTDGNLSRHITALEKAGAVRVEKTFVGVRPRTTVSATQAGRKNFLQYLEGLEEVLAGAIKKSKAPQRESSTAPFLEGAIKTTR